MAMKRLLLAVLVASSSIAPAMPAIDRHDERRPAGETLSVESPSSPILLACENGCARPRYTRE
jgi:hypothetical protein